MLTMGVTGFDWDNGNRDKCQKHGVSVAALESLFNREITIFPDMANSQHEERFIAIGKTDKDRHIFVVFTIRCRDTEKFIRPISARYMHRKEIEYYEKEITKTNQR